MKSKKEKKNDTSENSIIEELISEFNSQNKNEYIIFDEHKCIVVHKRCVDNDTNNIYIGMDFDDLINYLDNGYKLYDNKGNIINYVL
jgi:hypothetical protein